MAIGAGLVALLVGVGLALPFRLSKLSWSFVQSAQAAGVDEHAAVPTQHARPVTSLLKGKSYREARTLLMKEGWMPRRNPGDHGESADVQVGSGPAFWEEGYHELAKCSGTGYGLCRFEYNDAPGDHTLVVITAGVENPEDDDAAIVDRVFLDKRLVETSAGK